MKKPDMLIIGLNDMRRNQLVIHNRQGPDQRGQYALELTKLLMHLGEHTGETSAGFSILTPYKPADAVAIAIETTKLIYKSIVDEGWTVDYPPYDEIEATQTNQPKQPGFK